MWNLSLVMSEKSITYNYTYVGFVVVTVSRSTTESDMTRLVDFLADLKINKSSWTENTAAVFSRDL